MAQHGDETILDEAKSLLVQGKRFMALDDFQSATDCLEQSCQLFDAYYGVAKRECADAYLEYGLALVALANMEAGTGTDKIIKKAGIEENGEDGEDDDDDDDDGDDEEAGDEEDDGDSADAKKENGQDGEAKMEHENTDEKENPAADAAEPMESSSQETKSNGVTSEDNGQPQASSSSAPEPTPGTSVGGDTGQDKDTEDLENEEATTIEIAWEVLCLAKRLYMTDESLDGRLKLAETLQKIGEISIEWDNNDNAVSILEECLKIRSAILQPDDRLIAVTYYHLGLAHSFKSDTINANENFQNAINVIEKRIETLTKDLEKAKEVQDTVAVGAYQKEINELKELLPDMTMRLDDSKEDGTKSTEVLKRTREEMIQEDEEAKKVCSDKSKPVDDISHLVKRKAA